MAWEGKVRLAVQRPEEKGVHLREKVQPILMFNVLLSSIEQGAIHLI